MLPRPLPRNSQMQTATVTIYTVVLVIALSGHIFAAASDERIVLEGDSKLHWQPNCIPRLGWQPMSSPPLPSDPKRLYVALKQRNVEMLAETAIEISTPTHARYGDHLSLEEVATLVSPPQSSLDAVLGWIAASGASSTAVTASRDFVVVDTNVRTAEVLLNTTLVRCARVGSADPADPADVFVVAPAGYSVPVEIAALVDFVGGVTRLPPPPRRRNIREAAGMFDIPLNIMLDDMIDSNLLRLTPQGTLVKGPTSNPRVKKKSQVKSADLTKIRVTKR